MKLSALKVDADKIEAGEWVGDIPEMGDLRLRVRGLQNAGYRRLQSRLIDAVPRSKKQGGRVDPDELDRITSTCLASTVLLDWAGLEDEGGAPLPYSKETATEFLTNPAFRRFRDAVLYAATVVGDAGAETEKADAGN
ncbi:hypothetical protein Q8W71_17690 [Methylobacterium sp. NEAU 140]|uniref:hypothetical protein n=1 Tax=Methylobacterium sp. NEAU 140 TaxID=3064945 RepID=UPI00273595AB|nr:hypothetical protein [Methylobacterium sp. NEAU 140]MDP4024461.1 hypothetical protein [Methylobacterium sp. NEAU 140]